MAKSLMMTEADLARVTAAVHAAEGGTSGEIVTIVADHSDRYLDVALWWSIFAAILALAVLATFPDLIFAKVEALLGGWVNEWSRAEVLEMALALVILKFAGVRLLMQWVPLRLFLTPAIVKSRRVRRRAIRYFKVGAERRTLGKTGILIYLSLAERKAEIVADEAIHALVPQEAWGDAMADLIAGVREGRLADGMIAAVDDVGAILAKNFPRSTEDRNELPDRLIEL